MGRGVKLALASAVLLSGMTIALLYRRPTPTETTIKPADGGQPVVRPWIALNRPPEPPKQSLAEVSPVHHPRATIRSLLDRNKPPPELARTYPRPDNAPWPGPREFADDQLPKPDNGKPVRRIHKVADGDTLQILAQRYLDSADRAAEIFEANRNVLETPDALPIGIELRIPLPAAPATTDDRMLPEQPLVPVRE